MTRKEVISKINPLILNGIAHRGLHNKEFTENGLKAFKNAIDKGIAFEFDVHLTKDNELVVCHDSSLKRTTGKEGIIEELTLSEIKENYKLLDGGVISTLKEVIQLNQEKVPMVIELKTYKDNFNELAIFARVALKQIKDKRNVMIISFDLRCLEILNDEGFVRSLLISEYNENMWDYRNEVECIDIDKKMLSQKRVIRHARRHFVMAWTIESIEQLHDVISLVDSVTFQHLDPKVVKEALQNNG